MQKWSQMALGLADAGHGRMCSSRLADLLRLAAEAAVRERLARETIADGRSGRVVRSAGPLRADPDRYGQDHFPDYRCQLERLK